MITSDPDSNRDNPNRTHNDSQHGTMNQNARDDIQDVKNDMESMAREKAEAGQHRIREGADALSDAIDAAASELDDQDREGLARYARKLGSNISHAAEQIENRSVDDLARQAKQLARENPALFMLGSIAVGFGLSRFFKASADRDHHDAVPHAAEAFRSEDIPSDMSSQRAEHNAYGTSTSHYTDGRNTL